MMAGRGRVPLVLVGGGGGGVRKDGVVVMVVIVVRVEREEEVDVVLLSRLRLWPCPGVLVDRRAVLASKAAALRFRLGLAIIGASVSCSIFTSASASASISALFCSDMRR